MGCLTGTLGICHFDGLSEALSQIFLVLDSIRKFGERMAILSVFEFRKKW
jgi:hypothetical protein